MKQRPRIYYTESQKALMWKRWKQGDSLQMIAQMFGRNHSSIQGILAQTGGIRPAPRCRSKLALTLAERKYPVRWLQVIPFVRSQPALVERHPPSVEKSNETAVRKVIVQIGRTRMLGIGRAGPNLVS